MKKLVQKIKDTLSILSSSKGFTLLELLVVVLIIGILASIALPQYQMAVGKSELATIKAITKNIQETAQVYYMIHNSYDNISVNKLDITIPEDIHCYIWSQANEDKLYCEKNIFNAQVRYYLFRSTGKPQVCLVLSKNTADKANRLCQKETGKTASQAACHNTGEYCTYSY